MIGLRLGRQPPGTRTQSAWNLLAGILAKAHIKGYRRVDSRSGQVVQVREHDDKRLGARPKLTLGRRPKKIDGPAAARARSASTGHRFITVHQGGPETPGHTARMVPHPSAPGRWQVHEADRDILRGSLAGRAPQPEPHHEQDDPESARAHRRSLLATAPMPDALPDEPHRYFTMPSGTIMVPLDKLKPIRAHDEGLSNAPKYMQLALEGKIPKRKPLEITPDGEGGYTIADGNSTYATAKKYGWKALPGIPSEGGREGPNGRDEQPKSSGGEDARPEDELCPEVDCEDFEGYRVPRNESKLREIFERGRQAIAKALGGIGDDAPAAPFSNGARSVDELIADSRATEATLRELIDGAAAAVKGESFYGEGGKNAVKTPESIGHKIRRIMSKNPRLTEADAVQKIGDGVRGSLLVDTPEQVRAAITELRARAKKQGTKIVVDNKFADPDQFHKGGYAAIHCDVEFQTKGGRTLRGELQVHLRSVYDGTPTCVKDRTHKLLELAQGREGTLDAERAKKVNLAGVLLFASAFLTHAGGGGS